MTLLKYTELPAFKLLLLIAVGIGAGSFIYWELSLILLTFFIALVLGFICYRIGYVNFVFIIFGITIGLGISYRITGLQSVDNKKITPEQSAIFQGTVEKILSKDSTYMRFLAFGELDTKSYPMIKDSKVIISVISKNEQLPNLHPGNQIFANLSIHTPHQKILPTEPDEKRYAVSVGAQWFGRTRANEVAIIKKTKNLYSLREEILEKINDKLNSLFGEDTRGLAVALVTGDQNEVPKETRLSYSLSGTVHVLAVSGLHVGIISALVLLLTGFLKNRWLKFVVFSICLCFYIFLTGFQPSAIRAGVMAITSMLLYTIERRINLVNVLSFSVIIILLFQPEMVYSAGYQMSVASILGIGIFFIPVRTQLNKLFKRDNSISNYFTSSVALSISASIIVSPIVAHYFGIYSIISPLANIFVVPLTMLCLIFTLFSLFFSMFFWQISVVYASAAEILLKLSSQICSVSTNLPYAYLNESNVFLISIIISLGIIYLLFSSNWKQFVFRLPVVVITFLFLLNIFGQEPHDSIKFYPREKVVLTEVKLKDGLTFALISDRKPSSRPSRDYPLEKYLSEKKDSLIVGIGGLTGMNITDEIKKVKSIKLVELDLNNQLKITKLISKSVMIPQMIELSN